MKNSSRIHDVYVPYRRVGGARAHWGYLRRGCSIGGDGSGGNGTGEVMGVVDGSGEDGGDEAGEVVGVVDG